jgi:hypothetical protein
MLTLPKLQTVAEQHLLDSPNRVLSQRLLIKVPNKLTKAIDKSQCRSQAPPSLSSTYSLSSLATPAQQNAYLTDHSAVLWRMQLFLRRT